MTRPTYLITPNLRSACQKAFGSVPAAAKAVGVSAVQLGNWAQRKHLPRPVYEALRAASRDFPMFKTTKLVRNGRAYSDTQSARPAKILKGPKASPDTREDASTAALRLLTAELNRLSADNDALRNRLSRIRAALD